MWSGGAGRLRADIIRPPWAHYIPVWCAPVLAVLAVSIYLSHYSSYGTYYCPVIISLTDNVIVILDIVILITNICFVQLTVGKISYCT